MLQEQCTKDYLQIYRNSALLPLQDKYRESEGGTIEVEKEKDLEECKCKIKGSCKKDFSLLEEQIEDEINYCTINIEELEFIAADKCYNLLESFSPDTDQIISRLDKIGIIGELPIKFWDKDRYYCQLKIKNPDYRIITANIKADNRDEQDFEMHIKELESLGLIRKSESPHRSAAFIVRNHAEIVRGKSRMVINYKRLKDNTVEDAYKIPDKDQLINRIQGCSIFSKFDCKSGFYQVKMHQDSIEWTAFTCPQGHYEWLVMPFGLKNAPSIFQRRMDSIFEKHRKFVIVYIDDILVFSKSKEEHISHLKIVFSEFLNHGIIISKKKMEIGKKFIKFLGAEIGQGKIKLQAHISQKILGFPEKLEELKVLQQFLGLVNYARPYIKNLSRIIGPLYSKTSQTDQRYFNQEDILIVRQVKEIVKNLPELELPLDSDYLIIQTDGSSKGWGAILIKKPHKYSPASEEKICRYSSGSYKEKGNISSIDAELLAVIYALDSFELFIISKKEFTIRTDCEVIDKFYKNKESKKSSQRRWLNFTEKLSSRGFKPEIEHVKGKGNSIADVLSRLITFAVDETYGGQDECQRKPSQKVFSRIKPPVQAKE